MKLFLALSLFLGAQAAQAATQWGPARPLGMGKARTYVETHLGRVERIGILVSERALQGLPNRDLELVLPLPLARGVSPIQNVVLNWNPHGHEPNPIYGTPHFDFHFYVISEMERMRIRCTRDDASCMRKPEARFLPPQYGPAPDGVPMMGWHWVDLLSPEFHGKPFGATFIYGYYAGKPAFIEPMITKSFLERRTRFTAPIRLPEAFARDGRYPRAYEVEWDFWRRAYRISLLMR